MKPPSVLYQSKPLAIFNRAHLDHRLPYTHLLANGQLDTMFTAAGSGFVRLQGQAVTRWIPDRTRDADGYFIFLRDLDTHTYWSAGFHPTIKKPDNYQVAFHPGSVELLRVDEQLQTKLDVCVAADINVDLRRCTITNLGTTPRRVELTSYAETVLGDPAADSAHPAFSKLFVETELVEEGVLLARRRRRSAKESSMAACHFIAGDSPTVPDQFETDRCRFIGRGKALTSPAAMASPNPLSGTSGSVLDSILSLRRVLFLPPGASASIAFILTASYEPLSIRDLLGRFKQQGSIDEAFESAHLAAGRMLRSAGRTSARLADAIDSTGIRFYGSFDFDPLQATPTDNQDLLTSELQQGINELAGLSHSLRVDRSPENVSHSASPPLDFFEFTANSTNGDLPLPPSAANGEPQQPRDVRPVRASFTPSSLPNKSLASDSKEQLQQFNGWGGFSADGSEYVVQIRPSQKSGQELPPSPWCNVIANEQAGFVVSETGAGFTWVGNSQLNRLTPWSNDPVCDSHGEAIYLRDEDSKVYWSPLPGPVSQPVSYEVRHGFGYTSFSHISNDLHQEVVQYVPRNAPIKITRVRLTNLSDNPRRLSIFSYHQWQLGSGHTGATWHIKTAIDKQRNAVLAVNPQREEYSDYTAFAALIANRTTDSFQFTCDRQEFLGRNGSVAKPRAVESSNPLYGRSGTGFDPCAVCRAEVQIAPDETIEFTVLLGAAPTTAEAVALIDRYQAAEILDESLLEIQDFWKQLLSAVRIETPSNAINLMVNGWLPYQDLSCRIWARSSAYQSGGAFGYRDQLQDAAALIHHWPQLTRKQILRNAAHQFVEGDVLHWWHPPQSRGIRTAFSDDLLWLPLIAAEYVETTGDHSLWHENIRFVSGPSLPTGEAEISLIPSDSGTTGSVYEHCCRALDRGLTRGPNGLPLIGCGDWNDGMNRVGQAGTGESVWLGFFIDYILEKFLPICEQFQDSNRVLYYCNYRELLRTSLNEAGWDGKWYRRAFFDDGTPLGSNSSSECRIDAIVQAWAVLSGAAPPERVACAIAAVDEQLVDENAGLIRLLDPPFDRIENDPGYIKGYVPGVRENGGQYTHGVLWFIRAMAELGRGSQAVKLLEMLSPVNHGNSPEKVSQYKIEPYVVAADVYSQPPHLGRGGWPWYTGSAGWMFRVTLESILGIRLLDGRTLQIDPRISADWPECRVDYRLADGKTTYEILIKNPEQKEMRVSTAVLDGHSAPVVAGIAKVPIEYDGKRHLIILTL